MNNVHGVALDPVTKHVYVNDRGNHRVQVFDENGKYLSEWSMGGEPSDVHLIYIGADRTLWAFDRGTSKMLKYDLDGHFLYSWGSWGDFPGGFWGVHGFSVDQDGNFYTAEVVTMLHRRALPGIQAGVSLQIFVGFHGVPFSHDYLSRVFHRRTEGESQRFDAPCRPPLPFAIMGK
jgi:hypothetical protein